MNLNEALKKDLKPHWMKSFIKIKLRYKSNEEVQEITKLNQILLFMLRPFLAENL